MNNYVSATAGLICAVLVYILCRNAPWWCLKFNIMDMPDARKQHASATPLMGGLALQFAALPVLLLATMAFVPAELVSRLLLFIAAVTAMSIIGLADDRHSLSARDRLIASFLVFGSAGLFDPVFNVRVLLFEHPAFQLGLGTGWLSVIFTSVCCVGLVNAINMADGKNGLVCGLCVGWLLILSARAPDILLLPITVLTAALLVLLVFNLRGRLFLGDGGSYGFATAIGLLTIATYNAPGEHVGRALSAEEVMLLFAVPVADAFRLTFSRLRQGRSPLSPDRNHLHHHLMSRFGWPNGLLIYYILALFPAAAVILPK